MNLRLLIERIAAHHQPADRTAAEAQRKALIQVQPKIRISMGLPRLQWMKHNKPASEVLRDQRVATPTFSLLSRGVVLELLGYPGEPAMIVSLRVAAVAGLMAVASTPVMAQTTGTLPAQPPPYGVAPPPVCTENSNSDIMVMQSTKDRVGMDTSSSLNWARERRVLL